MINKLSIALTILLCAQPVVATSLKLCGVHWPPYTIATTGQQIFRGLSYEVHREAFQRLNIEIEVTVLPWIRCVAEVKAGRFDAIIDADPSSFGFLAFGAQPTLYNPIAIFVRADFPSDEYSANKLKGKTVAIIRGYAAYSDIAKQHGWEIELTLNEKNTLQRLQAGQFDYAFLDLISVPGLSGELGINVKYLRPVAMTQLLHLGFNSKHYALMLQHDDVIKQMISDGTMDKLYYKFLPYSYIAIRKQSAD